MLVYRYVCVYIYIDDLIFTDNHLVMFELFKRSMVKEFEMMEWA